MTNRTGWILRSFSGLGVLVLVGCSDGSSTDVEVEVTVTPRTAELEVGTTLEISAAVSGATDPSVDWAAECGTIEGTGIIVMYTAPWSSGTCNVTATSREDASKSASAAIVVTPIPANLNLLTNYEFDTDLDPWTTYLDSGQPRAVWNSEDAQGSSGSGSALLRHPGAGNGGTWLGINVCIPSAPGRQYRYGGSARRLQAITNQQVWVLFGPAAAECGDFAEGTDVLTFPESGTDWTHAGKEFTAPAGTTIIRISVGIWKASGVLEPTQALVDDLFVVEK